MKVWRFSMFLLLCVVFVFVPIFSVSGMSESGAVVRLGVYWNPAPITLQEQLSLLNHLEENLVSDIDFLIYPTKNAFVDSLVEGGIEIGILNKRDKLLPEDLEELEIIAEVAELEGNQHLEVVVSTRILRLHPGLVFRLRQSFKTLPGKWVPFTENERSYFGPDLFSFWESYSPGW